MVFNKPYLFAVPLQVVNMACWTMKSFIIVSLHLTDQMLAIFLNQLTGSLPTFKPLVSLWQIELLPYNNIIFYRLALIVSLLLLAIKLLNCLFLFLFFNFPDFKIYRRKFILCVFLIPNIRVCFLIFCLFCFYYSISLLVLRCYTINCFLFLLYEPFFFNFLQITLFISK